MEGLLLISLRILRAANAKATDNNRLGQHLLKLSARRDKLLSALHDEAPQTPADQARWELVRYVNQVAQKKITAQI